MVQHVDMVSAKVHEPKHISDSTVADAGKVITPLSGGTSELRNLTPIEVGIKQYYVESGVSENATAVAVTAASDANLYTGTDFTKLTSANIPGAVIDEQFGITFDSTNYDFEIPVNGVYKTEFFANVLSNINNSKVGFKFTLNGTPASDVVKHDLASSGRVANISSTFISSLNAGDNVGMSIACDKTANITITDMKVVLFLIREL